MKHGLLDTLSGVSGPFEVLEDRTIGARFHIFKSDETQTILFLELPPGTKLAPHNRPKGRENLLQVLNRCMMELDGRDVPNVHYELTPGQYIDISEGRMHVHSNPGAETSFTFVRIDGDIQEIVEEWRRDFTPIDVDISLEVETWKAQLALEPITLGTRTIV